MKRQWITSGTTGFDYATMTIADDAATQTEQCFHNIATVLAQAGCTLAGVTQALRVLQAFALRNDGISRATVPKPLGIYPP